MITFVKHAGSASYRSLPAGLLVFAAPVLFHDYFAIQPDQETLVITHVAVIDATGAPVSLDMTVVITGNIIAQVGKSGAVRIPREGRIIDAAGKFLIPGL
jgi:cytosine/adenosine deaminase-related metal-dependent hydrolase